MVSGRAHEGENFLTGQREFGRIEGGADGAAGVIVDAGEVRRVGVEVGRLLEATKHGRGVGEEEDGCVGDGRETPFPGWMRGTEMSCAAGDASGLFRPHGGAVISALGIVEDEHGL